MKKSIVALAAASLLVGMSLSAVPAFAQSSDQGTNSSSTKHHSHMKSHHHHSKKSKKSGGESSSAAPK